MAQSLACTWVKTLDLGDSLMVQWLSLCTFTAKGLGLMPGRGTEIPQAMGCGKKKPQKTSLGLGLNSSLCGPLCKAA